MDVLSPTTVQHLIQAYGLWVVFAVVMLEGMGIPVPGETALITAALYAGSTHQLGVVSVVLVAAMAAIVGDNIGYLIGRSIGIRLIMRYGRHVRLNQARLKMGQYLFLRHGGKIVLCARFVTLLRSFAALLAGVNRRKWPYFLIMNAIRGTSWALLFGGGAYLFGEELRRVTRPVSLLLLISAIGLIITGIIFFQRHEKEWEQRAEATFPGPLQ